MAEKTYHHGNLRQELMEKGLQYVERYGVESLSMRKLAESAGVSSAAPYAHFKNKEDFLKSVQEYITEQFGETLKKTAERCGNGPCLLLELGKSYVLFFSENPTYYRFLFTRGTPDIRDYEPFMIFSSAVCAQPTGGAAGENAEGARAKTLALWSMVHGLAQIATIPGALDPEHLEEEIERILNAVTIK